MSAASSQSEGVSVVSRGLRLCYILLWVLLAPLAWAAPVITSISPTSGQPGTQVTITGSGFGSAPGTVVFNGASAQIVSWSTTGTQMVVKAPNGVAGSGPVVVNGQSNGVTFNFTPTITNISPQNVAIGQTETAVGLNFGTKTGTVTVSGKSATILSWKNTAISFTVPSVATGADPVVVTNSIGSSPAVTLNVSFSPTITSISPTQGQPGTQVTINGTGFGTTAGLVTFNGAPAQIVSWASTKIVVDAPNGLLGSGPVVVSFRGASSNGVTFNFLPTIVALIPNTVKVGYTFGIVGENFLNAAGSVTLNGSKLTTKFWSNFLILATVPTGAKTGPVVVTTSVGASNSLTLTVQGGTTPLTISAVASPPPNSAGWNNTSVTVTFTCNGGVAPVQCPAAETISTQGANQVITGTAKDASGATATASVTLNIDTSPPVITAAVSPAPNSNGWINQNATVTFTCSDAISGIASCPGPVTVAQGASQVITGTATDVAGNSASTSVTLNVSTTLPTITASVSPAPNANGWNTTPVTVRYKCMAGFAPVQTCPSAQTVSTAGANQQVTGAVTDAAGNTATVTTTVNIDLAGPAISATETPAPDSYGWNNTAVTVSFICTPSAAPIVSCSSSQTVSTAGANQPVTGTAVDAAGLTASTTALVSIDLTPPTITITSPANGATLTTSPVSVSGNVSAALAGIASVSCNGVAATVQSGSYSCSVPLSAGTDTISVLATDMAGNTATQSINTTLIVPATISSFSPSSTSIGSLVTVQGSGFSQTGFPPEVTLTQEGGGTIVAPISSTTANTLSFVVPSGAATGPITVTVDGLTAASSSLLTIVGSSSFSLTAGPSSVTLLPGQTATVQVSLASGNGFTQLAALSLAGLPSGVTATFQPPQITAGGTSLLSLSAPASQTASTSSLTIAATATVQGIPETQTAAVLLNIQIPSGSVTFTGQIAVTGVYNTPLVGVSVSFTGKNYTGAQTGCTGSATTDAGGNFILNGSSSCAGSQMIQYDPSTVTSPPGKYSGVTLSYVLTAGQVTTPGIVVHLPNVTNAETFSVSQNSTTNQTFVSQSIRGLSITVYAGTTFSLADGTQPSPFPLSVVEIPYSQIPDYMPPNPTEDPIFAMSIEPFNSSSNQPVAITFPNRKNTLPGTDMPLTSLNPTLGMMVNYGTGVVSADGTRIVPDPDPANPGHLYGISHFDWHFPLPGPGGGPFPGGGGGGGGSGGGGPGGGDPVDAATGILTLSKPDIAIGGARGQIAVVRSYQEMTSGPGPFGIGTNHNYNWRVDMTNLSSVQGAASVIGLVRPDGNEFAFSGTAGGTFTNTSVPTVEGSTITTSQCFTNDYGYGCSATLTWRNGTVYKFSPLVTGEPFAGFLTSITDPNGNTITILHDNSSNPTLVDSIIDPVGRSLTFSYNGSVITSITDPIGRSVQYTYNSIGKLATVVDLGGGTTTYTYNGQGQLASITDARNITYLQNFYDSNGRVIQQTAADGGNTYFSYTQLNPAVPSSPISSTTITDPLGNTTTYNFNAMSVPISVTDAKGQTTVYNIDPNTNLTDSVVDPLQRTTAFTYDPYGNTTSITRLFGTSNAVTTNYTYGAFNRLTSVTDAMGHTTSYTYDNKGNLFTKADPLGHQINYAYDSYGEPASVTDPLGNTVVFSYVNGALATITDPLGNVTTRVTDAVARLTSITNPLGQTTSYQYNNQNNITSVTNAIDGVTSFSYDPNGNLLTVQDARQQGTNNMTVYAYDSMDRLMTRTDPLGRQESYTHDQDGNITSVADRRGVVTKFQYDTLNRRYFMGFGANGSSYQSTVTYNYDAGSRVYSVVDSSSGTVTSQLDGRDNLLSETGPLGSISYGYDPAGRRTSSVMSGQPAVNYVYDNTNRLTLIKQGSSTTAFSYDNSNRRIAMTLPNSIVANYGYDADSHVTSISYQIGSTSIGNLSYTYDAGGRRTQVGGTLAGSGFPSAVASATYDTANELINWNGTSISYDANGSILNDGTANYTWNERNQLVGRGSVTYQYDAFGRRIRNASGHGLLYDGDQPTQEQSAGIPITNWLAGSIDEIFSISGSNGVSIPLTDALGSVLALANSAGTVVTQYTYDPFGNAQTFGVASSNTFQFQGRENDGTGLYYYRARYYSPSLHRFVSQDPLGYVAGANTYTYGFNNPVSVGDPSGKSPCVVGALAGVILYNSYTIYQEINSAVHGRKGPNPGGWSGAWQILTGSASAAVTGCAVADGAAGFWDALGSGAQGAAEGVAQAAGQLPQEVADTYENGQYTARVLDEDTIYYRAETDSMPDGPGRWFGTEAPGTEAEADQMYNISGPNPANEMNVVNSYNVPAGTTVYEGPVAGGTGTQIYIPNPVGSGVTQIGSTPLPDYIPR